MTVEELQSELAQVQVLRHLTFPSLQRLVQSGRLVQAKTGQVIIAPGFGSRGFFVILSGTVAVHMPNNGPSLARLGPKQFFGEIALLEEVERTASCSAETDSILFEIPPQTFHSDLVTNPMVKAGMLATVKLRRAVQERTKTGQPMGVPAAAQPSGVAQVPRPAVPTPAGLPQRPAVPAPAGLPRPAVPTPAGLPRPAIPTPAGLPRPGIPTSPGLRPGMVPPAFRPPLAPRPAFATV